MTLRFRSVAALLSVTVLVACLRVGSAWAQAPSAPPDIVRLKNGGMLRGTIIELVPGDRVSLLGVDGQTRNLPMTEVAYAGPVANDPLAAAGTPATGAPPAPAPVATAPHRGLRLVADEPNLTYHYFTGTSHGMGIGAVGGQIATVGVTVSHYTRLCTAPCETPLEPGSYTFALERQNGAMVVAPAMSVRGDEELRAHWISRSAARWSFFIAGLALATTGVVVGAQTSQSCSPTYGGTDPWGQPINLGNDCTTTYPHLLSGTVLFSVGLTSMIVPLLIRDSAQIVPTGR
jgi:hypothetical protein